MGDLGGMSTGPDTGMTESVNGIADFGLRIADFGLRAGHKAANGHTIGASAMAAGAMRMITVGQNEVVE